MKNPSAAPKNISQRSGKLLAAVPQQSVAKKDASTGMEENKLQDQMVQVDLDDILAQERALAAKNCQSVGIQTENNGNILLLKPSKVDLNTAQVPENENPPQKAAVDMEFRREALPQPKRPSASGLVKSLPDHKDVNSLDKKCDKNKASQSMR